MKLTQATDTCEAVAEQLVRDIEVARKCADNLDPVFGWQVEIFKRKAVDLKNDLTCLAGAVRRRKAA